MSAPPVLLTQEICSYIKRYRVLTWWRSLLLKVGWGSGARPAHRSRAASAHGTPLARGRGGRGEDCAQPFRELDERSRNFPGKLSYHMPTVLLQAAIGRTTAPLCIGPYSRWCIATVYWAIQ